MELAPGAGGPVFGPPQEAKPFVVYDDYTIVQPDGTQVSHINPGVSVADFRASNIMFHRLNWASKISANAPTLAAELGRRTFNVASEAAKTFIRSCLEILKELEANGESVLHLNRAHIRVFGSGNVKPCETQSMFRVNVGQAQFDINLRANYNAAVAIFRYLFSYGNLSFVPEDIEHLLQLMLNHFGHRDIFPEHASLVPLGHSSLLFKDYHDYLIGNATFGEYHTVCSAVANSCPFDWRLEVQDNLILKKTYFFRNGGAEYWQPYNLNNQVTLTDFQKKALGDAYFDLQQRQLPYLTPFELAVIDGHKMLTFLRNRFAHRMEAMLRAFAHWSPKGNVYTAIHTELVNHVRFQIVVPVLQYELYKLGYRRKVGLL